MTRPAFVFNQHNLTFGDLAVGDKFVIDTPDERERRKVDNHHYSVKWSDGSITVHSMPRGPKALVRRAS